MIEKVIDIIGLIIAIGFVVGIAIYVLIIAYGFLQMSLKGIISVIRRDINAYDEDIKEGKTRKHAIKKLVSKISSRFDVFLFCAALFYGICFLCRWRTDVYFNFWNKATFMQRVCEAYLQGPRISYLCFVEKTEFTYLQNEIGTIFTYIALISGTIVVILVIRIISSVSYKIYWHWTRRNGDYYIVRCPKNGKKRKMMKHFVKLMYGRVACSVDMCEYSNRDLECSECLEKQNMRAKEDYDIG